MKAARKTAGIPPKAIAQNASTMVIQFSQAKLPVNTSHNWVRMMIVAATDANLEEQIREGRFKAPLMHRLAGYDIRLPPLRERREDIAPLAMHFLKLHAER